MARFKRYIPASINKAQANLDNSEDASQKYHKNQQRNTGSTSTGSAANIDLSSHVSLSFNDQSRYKDAFLGSNVL